MDTPAPEPATDLRPGEATAPLPATPDAGVYFIGTIRTPWQEPGACPRQGSPDGPPCRIELDPRWLPALDGIEAFGQLQVLYWMHRARRDVVRQSPHRDGTGRGTFTIRSPLRPNPVAVSTVVLERREGAVLHVRGLDCVDGTPLIDLKPLICTAAARTPAQDPGRG